MGKMIQVKAVDGHELGAYVATPEGEPIGAIVVVQEIFGVNESIRSVVDDYARHGFLAIAPAIFDRFERNLELGYTPEELKKAFELYPKLDPKVTIFDIAAAFAYAKESVNSVAVLGFCYGGLMSWLSATRGEAAGMTPSCTVGYYPGGVGNVAKEQPGCPVLLHFGAADSHIGPEQSDAVRAAHPDVTIYIYEGADHAFANWARPSYKEDAAKLAHERSLAFLKANIA
jgi:carboxymethylenebutenolidase